MANGDPPWAYAAGPIFKNSTWYDDQKGKRVEEVVSGLEQRIRDLEKRLCVIEANPVAMANFPALQEAYEQYKIIERLTIGNG